MFPHPLMNVLNAHQVAVLLQTKRISLHPRLCIRWKEVTFIFIFPPAWLTLAMGWKYNTTYFYLCTNMTKTWYIDYYRALQHSKVNVEQSRNTKVSQESLYIFCCCCDTIYPWKGNYFFLLVLLHKEVRALATIMSNGNYHIWTLKLQFL